MEPDMNPVDGDPTPDAPPPEQPVLEDANAAEPSETQSEVLPAAPVEVRFRQLRVPDR